MPCYKGKVVNTLADFMGDSFHVASTLAALRFSKILQAKVLETAFPWLFACGLKQLWSLPWLHEKLIASWFFESFKVEVIETRYVDGHNAGSLTPPLIWHHACQQW